MKAKSSAATLAASSSIDEKEQSAHDAADKPAANPAGDGSVGIKLFRGGIMALGLNFLDLLLLLDRNINWMHHWQGCWPCHGARVWSSH